MWLAVILYSGFLVSRFRNVREGFDLGWGFFFVCLWKICPEAVMLIWTFVNMHENTVEDTCHVVKLCWQKHSVSWKDAVKHITSTSLHQKQGCFVKLVHWQEDKDRGWCLVFPLVDESWSSNSLLAETFMLSKVLYVHRSLSRCCPCCSVI